jgi:hypothetical protein
MPKLPKMEKKHWTFAGIAGALAAIAGIYTSAEALGFKMDRPAWKSEVELIGEALQSLKKDYRFDTLNRLEDRNFQLEMNISRDRALGRQPKELDLKEQHENKKKIRRLKRELNIQE